MIITVLSWLATISVLVSYAVMTRTGWLRQFNVTNFVANFPLVAGALIAGLYANAFLSAAFGAIALWGLLRPPAPADDTAELLDGAQHALGDLATECEMQEAWASELYNLLADLIAVRAIFKNEVGFWGYRNAAGQFMRLDLDEHEVHTLNHAKSVNVEPS